MASLQSGDELAERTVPVLCVVQSHGIIEYLFEEAWKMGRYSQKLDL